MIKSDAGPTAAAAAKATSSFLTDSAFGTSITLGASGSGVGSVTGAAGSGLVSFDSVFRFSLMTCD